MAATRKVQDSCAAVRGGGIHGPVCRARVSKMSMKQSHQSHTNAADSRKIPKTYQRQRHASQVKDIPRPRYIKTKVYQDQGISRPRHTERQAGSSERKITVLAILLEPQTAQLYLGQRHTGQPVVQSLIRIHISSGSTNEPSWAG
jgi:hypothetical protein